MCLSERNTSQQPQWSVCVKEDVEAQAPAVRRLLGRSRLDQLSDIEREKYAIGNVKQCEELAEQLQFLVERHYYDGENGIRYQVESVKIDDTRQSKPTNASVW